MRSFVALLFAAAILTVATEAAHGAVLGSFIADSNQFGYQGTVSNTTSGTGPWNFPTPRDGFSYFVNNAPATLGPYPTGSINPGGSYTTDGNYNDVLSNWYQYPASDQNPGFFQLTDGTTGAPVIATATSATGNWTPEGGGLWDFTMTVSGSNASWANSNARLWQPDQNMAWGGTFQNYTYTLTATWMSTAVINGWRYNTIDPTGITGSFTGTFLSTFDASKVPIVNGDTYFASLSFSQSSWDDTNFDNSFGNYSYFAAPVPEPGTIASLAGLIGIGLGGLLWRRRFRARALPSDDSPVVLRFSDRADGVSSSDDNLRKAA